jgi:hypothetical protein
LTRSAHVVVAVALIALTACAAPPPDPAAILGRAADDLAAATTLRFTLSHEGKPVTLDPTTGAAFTAATGEYRAPDRVHAKMKVVLGPTLLSLDALWVPDGVFVTDPFFGQYRKLPVRLAFDAAALLGRDGVPAILRKLKSLTLVGTETVDGTEALHIRGSADGAELRALTGGALLEGTHTVDVWVDKARSRIIRVVDQGPADGGTWTLELSGYGDPVEITGP